MYRHCIAAIHQEKRYIKLLMYRDVSFPNMEIYRLATVNTLKQGARAHVQSCRALIQGHVAYRWAQPKYLDSNLRAMAAIASPPAGT